MTVQPFPLPMRVHDVQLHTIDPTDVQAPGVAPQVAFAMIGVPAALVADGRPVAAQGMFDPDTAIQVGEALAEAGREAKKLSEPAAQAGLRPASVADMRAATAAAAKADGLRG